ncbi:zinc finger CCCH domain-containing protein [Musa troglodytarum]|uniref:Zinc finger CCCH domain-containing protein n=1 Tax=Musa troglodytarum TaxID=320322 RepID=A0A9E7EKF0_9LILI|nr:zinc finger CCCH domain-containing protein [Musa troglodytarum]
MCGGGRCRSRSRQETSPPPPPIEPFGIIRRALGNAIVSGDDGELGFASTLEVTEKKKREYPVDPLLPDLRIDGGIYSTDEFRMFCFKVVPCMRAYVHDWTACPFVHPGETARRRDPIKYLYAACFPCPAFRRGGCTRGDLCRFAHGVFERWLHPTQYRTVMCRDGARCARRVCFFAHTSEELRAVPVLDFSATGIHIPFGESAAQQIDQIHLVPPFAAELSSPTKYDSDQLSPWPPQQQHSLYPRIDANVFKFPSPLRGSSLPITPPEVCFRLGARDHQSPSPIFSWTSKWVAPCEMQHEEVLGGLLGRSPWAEEPDVSWVQSLVGPPEVKVRNETRRSSASTAMDECMSSCNCEAWLQECMQI